MTQRQRHAHGIQSYLFTVGQKRPKGVASFFFGATYTLDHVLSICGTRTTSGTPASGHSKKNKRMKTREKINKCICIENLIKLFII
jgi:hypothetical protein